MKEDAKDLQRRISDALGGYARESQSLDQSFPRRLLSAQVWKSLSVDELKARMNQLTAKRDKLRRIRLMEENPAYPFDVSTLENVNDAQRSVMTLYVEDSEKKLASLDDLSRRIELMIEKIRPQIQAQGNSGWQGKRAAGGRFGWEATGA
ncbi:MAG: hypothetical protein IPK72_20935 [Candidatus Eisenbacteria bacterium]|nr:hypothetical protein [Candidatus Eisenbacteria bacterium]